eukprot:gene1070-biopygen3236
MHSTGSSPCAVLPRRGAARAFHKGRGGGGNAPGPKIRGITGIYHKSVLFAHFAGRPCSVVHGGGYKGLCPLPERVESAAHPHAPHEFWWAGSWAWGSHRIAPPDPPTLFHRLWNTLRRNPSHHPDRGRNDVVAGRGPRPARVRCSKLCRRCPRPVRGGAAVTPTHSGPEFGSVHPMRCSICSARALAHALYIWTGLIPVAGVPWNEEWEGGEGKGYPPQRSAGLAPQRALQSNLTGFCCFAVCSGVQRRAPGCTGVQRCAPVCNGVQRCATVCNGVHRCVPVCNGVHRCAPVCTGAHRCAPVCNGEQR